MARVNSEINFVEGAAFALGAAALGAGIYWAIQTLFSAGTSSYLVLALLASCYALYLVKRSKRNTGKLLSGTAFLACTALAFLFPLSLMVFIGILLLPVWILRSFYHRRRVLDSVMDLGLLAIGVFGAVVAAVATHSVFVTLWTFFIVQALHVFIPAFGVREKLKETPVDHFNSAFADAETALRQFYAAMKH